MKQIVIEEPYVKSYGEVSRLEAVIKGPEFEKIAYFEVQKEYEQFLCFERSDAFVMDLFYFAIINGYDIKCTAPVSERLYYQLTRTYIPALVKARPLFFHKIHISASLDNVPIKNAGAVGASVSGGVDSFYTILSNLNTNTKDYDVTHLLVANSYNVYFGEENTRTRYKKTVEHSRIIADDLGLPLIQMYSNHSEFWFEHYMNIFCLKYASYPYALQKLFSVYHFSSGFDYQDFSMTPHDWDSAHFDSVSVPQASNENFTFLLSGAEVGRAEKVIKIADNPVAQKRLQVCNFHQVNCSICSKCMRTEFNLYASDKLELFKESFDLSKFEKHKNRYLIRMLSVQESFDVDNIALLRKNKKIPLTIEIIGAVGHFYYGVRHLIRHLPYAVQVYEYLRKDPEYIETINKYNLDKEFAKKCDSGIV